MLRENTEVGRFLPDEEPVLIRFESEPFVVVAKRGYAPAAEVLLVKAKKRGLLLLGAQSLCDQLEPIRHANGGRLLGIELWVRKAGPERTAKYVLEQ